MNYTETLQKLRENIGNDIRGMRDAAGITQETLAELINREGRDAISKIERGINGINLEDYLIIVRFLAEFNIGHPAHPLVQHLHPARFSRT